MKRNKNTTNNVSKKEYPWRKNKKKWTDTLFECKLLSNPSLMTNSELAKALEEHQEWRMGIGKYFWKDNPINEKAETDSPFSPSVLSNLIMETIARLKIGGDLAMGRFKDHV
ncbi:MAG: hypothetical protein J6Q22_10295 [Prevotella sp.]|nr:hypothetical protein [Prevotella sp.]